MKNYQKLLKLKMSKLQLRVKARIFEIHSFQEQTPHLFLSMFKSSVFSSHIIDNFFRIFLTPIPHPHPTCKEEFLYYVKLFLQGFNPLPPISPPHVTHKNKKVLEFCHFPTHSPSPSRALRYMKTLPSLILSNFLIAAFR